MKNAPCVRLASRISPKISENPDDSRNSSPPSDRLLRPWMIQNCIPFHLSPQGRGRRASSDARRGRGSNALRTRGSPSPGLHLTMKSDPSPAGRGEVSVVAFRPEAIMFRELLLQILRRRIVACVDRVLQELGLVVGPELADI